MTVGQPETNLDTWGLRYVKKKKGDAMDLTGDAPTKSPQFGGGSELDTATANPSGRQNDSRGDTTGRYAASGKKVGEQVHEHKQEKGNEFGQKKPTYTTSGTKRGEGATQGADTTPSGQGEAGQALTAGTKETPVTTSSGLGGAKQTHTGSKGYNYGTDPPKSRGGHTIKPDSRNPKSESKPEAYGSKKPSKTPKGTLIQRASLDLAIIKCKLLKMNDISKKGEWDHLPHAQKEKEHDKEEDKVEKDGHGRWGTTGEGVRNVDDEKYSQGKNINYNSPHSEAGIQSGEITPHPKPVKGKHTEDTKYFSQEGEELGRGKEGRKLMEADSKKKNSDEIVEKAIELINEAYDEMKSTDFRKLKPTYEGDTKEAKKDAPASTGDVGAANFVYSDVHEKKKVRSQAQAEADKKEAEESDKDSKPSKPVKPKKGQKYDTDEYPAWHDRDTFY